MHDGTRSGRSACLWITLLAGLWAAAPAPATTNGVVTLNGSSWLRVANAPELNPTGGITIEAWIRPTTFAGFPTIVGKSYQNGYWLGLTTTGRVRFYGSGSGSAIDGVRLLPLNEWSHVAATFDGTTRRIYVDGSLDREVVSPARLPIPFADLHIGADVGGSYPFVGNLAEVRIWDHARSQPEIREDLVRTVDSAAPGLVAAFSLDGNAKEILKRFVAVAQGSPVFGGALPAPPQRSDPWRIPRLVTAPVTDGECLVSEWGFFRVPLYYDDVSPPSWVRLGSTATSLNVCFDGVSRSNSAFPSEARLALDVEGDATFFPDGDDQRLTLTETDLFDVEKGLDGGSGWVPDPIVSFYSGETYLEGDFDWSAELSVSRLIFPPAPDGFGIALVQDNYDAFLDITEWAAGSSEDIPGTWDKAVFDDDSAPPPDAAPPSVWINPNLIRGAACPVAGGERYQLIARATDDVDLATVEIYVDGAVVESCPRTGSADVDTDCGHDACFPPGRHRTWAIARDHVGRVRQSRPWDFFAGYGLEAPEISVEHAPRDPAPGEAVTITATASGDPGIDEIAITATTTPFGQTCTFPPGVTDATCELVVPAPFARTWFRYAAEATDAADREVRTGSRYAIYPISAADHDGDGLPSDLEDAFCTSAWDPDTDRDGLSDRAEILGFDSPTGGFVDLPALDADPCRKDVFLQFDYETGADLRTDVISDVVTAYRDHGIKLHVESNERPRPTSDATSSLTSISAAYQKTAGEYWFPPERNYTHHYAYSHHKVGRSGAWKRYFTLDVYTGDEDTCECPLSEPDPQANCDGAYGCFREDKKDQALRFMHELGHTVGLGHGGQTGLPIARFVGDYLYYDGISWQSTNHKPNHRSVMNYMYNGGDYCIDPTTTSGRPDVVQSLDYSDATLPALDEAHLDEHLTAPFATALRATTCRTAGSSYVPAMRFACFDDRYTARGNDTEARVSVIHDGIQARARFVAGSSWSYPDVSSETLAVDWNCDGLIQSDVQANVNGDGGDYLLPGEICDGMNDDPSENDDVDEGCNWSNDSEILGSMDEWQRIPRPPACIHPYRVGDIDDDGTPDECYAQTLAYRTEVGSLGTALDCRVDIDPSLEDKDCADQVIEFAGFPIEEELDVPVAPELPNTEICNHVDDDGDLLIDEGCRDGDGDGVADAVDVCPATPDPDQLDTDEDGLGDACDLPPPVGKITVIEQQGGFDVSWVPSSGEVVGYRVYREGSDGSLFHVVDTAQTAFFDAPQGGSPWVYRIHPLDLFGAEAFLNAKDTIPLPEPGAASGLLAGAALLGWLRRSRAGAGRR